MAARQSGHLVAGSYPADEGVELSIGRRPSGAGPAGERSADQDAGTARGGAGTPAFAAPGLVLLATIAIYEGYHWLRLIPNGALRPSAVVLAVIVVPATFRLTRRISGPGTDRIRSVARSCAVLLPALWIVLLIVRSDVVGDVLGAVSLALALSLVALAVLSEVGEHQPTGTY